MTVWNLLTDIGSLGGLLFMAFIAWGYITGDRGEPHGPRRWTLD